MTWVATAIIGGAVIGGIASNRAAGKQEDAANRSADLSQDQFDQTVRLQEPFRQGGMAAQNRMLTLLGLLPPEQANGLSVNASSPDFGKYSRDFGMSDFEADPGYVFRLSEGLKALQRTAAARGGLLSGATLKGATRFGQGLASDEYQNAFNRYQVNRANQLQPLQSLMGAGQSSANTIGQAGQTMAGNVGEAWQGGANARASGYMGVANAFNSGLGSYINYNQGQDWLKRLPVGGATPSYGGSSWMTQPAYDPSYGGP